MDSMLMLSPLAEKLRSEVRYLTDARTETLQEAERGRLENKRLTPSAQTWLKEVYRVLDDARELLDSYEGIEGLSLSSRYELDGRVGELLKEVRKLQKQTANSVIMGEAIPDSVELQTIPGHKVFGMDEYVTKVCSMLDDVNCPIIGIYGIGGVGKTTLLKEINKKFCKESGKFDLVIIVYTRDILKSIGNRLGYWDDCGLSPLWEYYEWREALLRSLCQKKFLLLLDDISDKWVLHDIGILTRRYAEKGSKTVFTTRSHKDCIEMGAGNAKVEVHPLNESNSWKLFCEKLGKRREEDWKGSTKFLANKVVKKCGGLPIALSVLGSSMVGADNDGEWEEILAALQDIGTDPGGMKNALTLLKLSFDRLKDERHKQCLLYCAVYPKDHHIQADELIDDWVGEGFLGKADDSIDRVRKRGLAAIKTLKTASLLEDGNDEEISNTVKLHDMIREMVLRITRRERAQKKTIFWSKPRENLWRVTIKPKMWKCATRISLSFNSIRELPQIPECRNLRTLLLNDNYHLEEIPSGFFQFMPHLTVLDLSATGLSSLPVDIGLLHELRFLNLSRNYGLHSPPEEFWGLKKLRILNVNETGLIRFPKEAISLFSSLQSLKLFKTCSYWKGGWDDEIDSSDKDICLKDLDSLKQLEELDLEVRIVSQIDWCGLLKSHNLCSVLTFLELTNLTSHSLDLVGVFGSENQLRELYIGFCDHLKHLVFPVKELAKVKRLHMHHLPLETIEWSDAVSLVREPSPGATFKNLWEVNFHKLALQEITWTGRLPCLKTLCLRECNEMEEMIKIEGLETTDIECERDSYFPALATLDLSCMQNLKSICRRTLFFPRLKRLFIKECSILRKLPFQLDSCKNLEEIKCDISWWNQLEWDDERVQSKFNTYFGQEDWDAELQQLTESFFS